MPNPSKTPDLQKIIVNADDFGLCAAVNRGYIQVYRAGNLSSTTLLVNMPGTEEAVELAKENPGLGVGLHFCITEGVPLTDCPSLVGEGGRFMARGALAKRLLKGKVAKEEIRREFEAQLERALGFGIALTHTDSHQHTMMFPPVFRAVIPVLQEHGLKARVVQPPSAPMGQLLARPGKFLKQTLNLSLAKKFRRSYAQTTNDVLVAVHDLNNPLGIDQSVYPRLLEGAPPDPFPS